MAILSRPPTSLAATRNRQPNGMIVSPKCLPRRPVSSSRWTTPAPGGGWQILSVWESESDLQRYFESAVKPYLPPEAPMAQSIAQVQQVITPQC